jgi:uncharacterized surface protein with fasciclin (FAS1) repeats
MMSLAVQFRDTAGPLKEAMLNTAMTRLTRAAARLGVLLGLAALVGLAGPVARTPAAQASSADIVDTAVAAGSFQTLATALKAAGLVDTLKRPGPYTVFAPTDEAFAKLPPGTLEALLQDPSKLQAVLTYHVVPGAVSAADVASLRSATTVQGSDLAIDATSGVKVNDATVVMADVPASNGIIHVIDTVLLPPTLALGQ